MTVWDNGELKHPESLLIVDVDVFGDDYMVMGLSMLTSPDFGCVQWKDYE